MNHLRQIRYGEKRMSQFVLRLATGIHQSKLSLIENELVEATKEEKEKIAAALLPEKEVQEAVVEIFGEEKVLTGSKKKNEK